MAGRWYRRSGADFIHGTMSLSLEEKGAYSICLDLIYERGGPIADDARWIAGVCGCSVRKWNAIRQRLIDLGKLVITGDGIFNSRAREEIENSSRTARQLAENGSRGGRQRVENELARNENNDIAEAGLTREEENRGEEKREEKKDAAIAAPETVETEDAQLYRRGKELLGPTSGGLIRRLVEAKGGSIPLARAAIETASTKANPREYIAAAAAGRKPPRQEAPPGATDITRDADGRILGMRTVAL